MDSKSSNGRPEDKSITPISAARIDTVSLTGIDTQDSTYRITTRKQMEDLLETIPSLGLLHPPILMENSSGYGVVSGFRRIAACRQLGWKSVSTRVLSAGQDRFQIAQLAIADNSLQRPLNLIETSRALTLLMDMSPDRRQMKTAAQTLGLPVNPSVAMKIQQLCRLAIPIQEGILSDTINLAMALELGKMAAKDAEMFVALFKQLKLGLNRQRELLQLATEIARREDISIQQLINEQPLQDILQNVDLDLAIQRQQIRSMLRLRRYPAITGAEANFQKQVRQLKLGKQIQLVPPRDFEGTTYAMTLFFENRQDLGDLNAKVHKIIEHPALGKILKR
ncbi:MAG: ParB N-terminal domain-containing protein [Desulfobacterales bacterium]|jgi:ParB family chromosome partitioning protein